VAETRRWGLFGGNKSLGNVFEGRIRSPDPYFSFSLLLGRYEVSNLLYQILSVIPALRRLI
jgi:hypothetical protein